MNDLKICPYNSTYNQSFYELNKAWIEEFWELEKSDLKNLLFAKMTVHKSFRGKGVSKILMNSCISYAKKNNNREVFLISNSKLEAAKKLYLNFGFVEVPLDSKKYIRGNYKMNLTL